MSTEIDELKEEIKDYVLAEVEAKMLENLRDKLETHVIATVQADRVSFSAELKDHDERIKANANSIGANASSISYNVNRVRWSMPTGTIIFFSALFVPGTYWLLCNGDEVKQDEYPNLYEVLAYQFKRDDGKVYLPDLRDQFIRGYDGRGPRGFGKFQADAVGRHNHKVRVKKSYDNYDHTENIVGAADTTTGGYGDDYTEDNADMDPNDRLDGESVHETRPKNLNLLACIKT